MNLFCDEFLTVGDVELSLRGVLHTATAEIIDRSLFLLCFYVHDTGEATFEQFAYLASLR